MSSLARVTAEPMGKGWCELAHLGPDLGSYDHKSVPFLMQSKDGCQGHTPLFTGLLNAATNCAGVSLTSMVPPPVHQEDSSTASSAVGVGPWPMGLFPLSSAARR
jgi:hypothetical protein